MNKQMKLLMLKKLSITFILFFMSILSLGAQAKGEVDPYKMVERVAEKTFARIASDQAEIQAKPEHLKTVVTDELLPYMDYRYAAYKVLGKNYKKFTKEQRNAFVKAFRDYLVSTYAGVFTLYKDQKVVFEPGRAFAKKKVVIIRTKVVDEGKPDINIDFKVRKTKKKGWLAYDMVAEGISLLDSKRAELTGLIRQQGLDSVTELLIEKSKRPIKVKKL